MKKLFSVIGAALLLLSCNEVEEEPQPSLVSTSSEAYGKSAKVANQEIQTLIRKWNEWIFTRDVSVAPFLDPDGSLQYLDQPYASGVFMLAPGVSPETVNRTVTISLSQYQYVFIPLVGTTVFYSPCDPESGLHGKQTFESFFQSQIKEAFNGPARLTLSWDDISLLPQKQKDLRANSGVWSFAVLPVWLMPCEETTTVYADGYWAKVPLSLGTHTLVVGGEITGAKVDPEEKGKSTFSSMVEYTLEVTE